MIDTRPQQAAVAPIRVQTPFGQFDTAAADLISFPKGLPGFEECRQFLLLSSASLAPFQCLQATDGPGASFIVVDPRLVLPGYRCRLTDADRIWLGATEDTVLLWLAIVSMSGERAHANLRAPIVINPACMMGVQLVPQSSPYPLRHPLPI